jgi:hypothetical protein
MEIQRSFPPMVFVRAGTYEVTLPDGKKRPKTAFNVGTLYFRHGAKSEPANSHDLKQVVDRQLAADRKALLSDVRMVTRKPRGTRVEIVPADLTKPRAGKAVPVRLTDDPKAPLVRALDPDRTHPFRQTELLIELNRKLPDGKREVTGPTVQCVRKVYSIDGKAEYSHKSVFGSRQYSQAFVDWMVEQSKNDKAFFTKARKKAKKLANTHAKAVRRRKESG